MAYSFPICFSHHVRSFDSSMTLSRKFKPVPKMEQIHKDRFNAKWEAVTETGCWLWTAQTSLGGYGQIRIKGIQIFAHRVAYELHRGKIPKGLQIDHLCRVRCCVNPWHMEPVTSKENTIRGLSPQLTSERAKAITHCPRGHKYNNENTYIEKNGGRKCRACWRIKNWKRRGIKKTHE